MCGADEIKYVNKKDRNNQITLRASYELRRNSYGFEIKKDFCKKANEKMLDPIRKQTSIFDVIDNIEMEEKIKKYKKKA